ncbi:hypothetical protein ACFV0H_28350 [Streptomyces erythrochromogenes]|uniref:hypothetical protein n=1 Tax=Streptomyces erythrochromogenes TaxID=285574 RepID=UPI003693708B
MYQERWAVPADREVNHAYERWWREIRANGITVGGVKAYEHTPYGEGTSASVFHTFEVGALYLPDIERMTWVLQKGRHG